MTTTKTATTIVGLLIQTERRDGYIDFRAYPVRLDSEGCDSVRNICASSFGDGSDLINGFYLPDLIIYACGSCDSRSDRRLFGYEATYERPYHVNARTAALMAKTLTTLDKKMAKQIETRGYVRSFGEYVGRIAEILGVTAIIKRPTRDAHLTDHTQGRYSRFTLGDGVTMIDGMVREWAEERNERATA